MLKLAHRIMVALITLAVVGGTPVQRARSSLYAAPVTMAGMPCDMTMSPADPGHGEPMAPCKGLTPHCIKQMGCVAEVGLPIRLTGIGTAERFSTVNYWFAWSAMDGMDRTPEPIPPRTT